MDKQIKEAELLPLTVIDTHEKTKQGSAIYNCTFEMQPGMPSFNAKAFSPTIAQELEKAIAEKRKVKIGYTENQYNGMPQYNIKSVDGKERSGFQKGKGFQRDTVSIERQASAKIAYDLLQFVGVEDLKDPAKKWEEFANKVYTWVSARPSEPTASGGQTDQKIDLNDIPPEFR